MPYDIPEYNRLRVVRPIGREEIAVCVRHLDGNGSCEGGGLCSTERRGKEERGVLEKVRFLTPVLHGPPRCHTRQFTPGSAVRAGKGLPRPRKFDN